MSTTVTSRLSALALALLTLLVFWFLQDFGPESTLRRFFQLAATDNWAGIDQLLAPSGRQLSALTIPEQEVIEHARVVAHLGAYRIVSAKVGSQEATLRVDYEMPNMFGPDEESWVLYRPPHSRWTIDLQKTAAYQFAPTLYGGPNS